MYTQCPDCSTAFRVTADILRQAAGKVRCGGCGNAFNALEYLSETMPEQAPQKELEDELPELTPEPLSRKASVPRSISAEQSAALLKTLDELAGSDIRIEDTGVEWRVLDDDELGDAADDEVAIEIDIEDQPQIDEILEDSPTPVDQFLTDTPSQIDSPEIFEPVEETPPQAPVDELRFDDNTPLPEDFDVDDSAPYDPPETPSEPEPEPGATVAATPQVDLDLSDPDEWTEILDEFAGIAEELAEPESHDDDNLEPLELRAEEAEEAETLVAAPDAEDDRSDDSLDEPLDMDSQFALQAEAMGIDLSGIHETAAEPDAAPAAADDLEALLEESGEEVRDLEDLLEEEILDENSDADVTVVGEGEPTDEEATQLELIDEERFDESEDERPEEVEVSVEHYVPPMTEEEQTLNLQIDQDLLAIAVEDDDGFASTLVLPEDIAEEKASDEPAADDELEDGERALENTGAGFETIIMEGEAFRSAMDDDKQEEHKAAAAASLASVAEAERAAEETARASRRRNYGIAAGIVALTLVLAGQWVHQARDSLATIPAFNSVVGPMYRAIGKPLSPDWDITGWRFEVTKGSTDEQSGALTVFSRIGNTSDSPLPYPLIGISLTDRFEETIGSRVLDPSDYLSNDLDPRKLVQPGNTFNAAITIESPSEQATGFKLNVCYRESGGALRCAIDDFK